jgi:hypothetical protein
LSQVAALTAFRQIENVKAPKNVDKQNLVMRCETWLAAVSLMKATP